MNKHVMIGVDGSDGGTTQCLGCRQYVYGSLTELPPGECPTPYKSPKQLLAEAVAREAALRDELGAVKGEYDRAVNKVDALQQRLTAADERADVLTSALEGMLEYFPEGHSDGECFSVEMAKAALKPAEVERNQCDGCQAGIPVVNGAHRMGKPDGYPDTMSCTAKMYVEERPDGCCCPPKGHTGLWAAAMCPVHQGLRALKR